MVPTGFPTGTVSSGRDGSANGHATDRAAATDRDARIAELERENDALRAAVEQQRRENDRIVERYERLLEQERSCGVGADESQTETPDDPGALARLSRLFRG